jgi:iron(III) transport system ATP-binding protein
MSKGLVLSHVSHAYGHVAAIEGVSLAIGAGQVLCLLGPSGCGKSTALRVAAGLERLQAGRIDIDGETVADAARDLSLPPERRSVGLVFQDYALFPHLDVLGNVAFGLAGQGSEETRARAVALLEQVGMAHAAGFFPHTLSGGEQQRVALARALARQPKVMLMDEPFSGLDTRLRDRVRDDTLSVLKASGVATLLVTHDPEEAMRMSDTVAIMRAGFVVQVGSPADLYRRPQDSFVAAFMGETNRIEATARGGRLATPWGDLPAPVAVPEGGRAEILIRPEALLARTGGAVATVIDGRLLGPYGVLRVGIEGCPGPLIMRSTGEVPAPGARLALGLDPAGVFVFPL